MRTFGNFRGLRPSDAEDRYLDEFFNRNARRRFFSHPIDDDEFSVPAINIHRSDSRGYKIEIAAPGFQKSDFNIDVHDHTLVVHAEREQQSSSEGDYTRREHNYSQFQRSFTLPEHIREDKIEATYERGMLHIHLPVNPEADEPERPRKIDIR